MARQDFTGPPLVAGTILGVRHWMITPSGLAGPTYPQLWGPGVNTATHRAAYWGDFANRPPPHPAGKQDCTCGFYAYYNIESSPYRTAIGGLNFPGIIEAQGRVSVGPYGFRAEKAKIIALSTDPACPPWWGETHTPDIKAMIRDEYPEVILYHSTEVMLQRHPTPRPSGLVDPGPMEDNPTIVTSGQIAVWSAQTSTTVAIGTAMGKARVAVAKLDESFKAAFTDTEGTRPESRVKIEYHYRDNPPPKPGWTQVSPAVHRYLPRNHQR